MVEVKKLKYLNDTTNIFLILFFGATLFFSMNQFFKYNDCLKSSRNKEIVDYSFLKKEINKGGRGRSYKIYVSYNKEKYEVDITSETYYKIEQGILPDLFYSKKLDLVFSKWSVKRFFRVFLVFMSFSIISLISLSWRFYLFTK